MSLVDPLRQPERFTRQVDAMLRAAPGDPKAAFDAIETKLEQSFASVLAGMAPTSGPPAAQQAPAVMTNPPPVGFITGASGVPYSATTFGMASGPLVTYAEGLMPVTGIPSAQLPVGGAQAASSTSHVAQPGAVGPALEPIIGEMAGKYDVPAWLVRNVIRQESGGNINARSPVGAMGLMQLMPGTAAELGVANAYDARQNVEGGTKYLRRMLDMFHGDMQKAVAAYNAGPGAVQRYGGVPPYGETQAYVKRILG